MMVFIVHRLSARITMRLVLRRLFHALTLFALMPATYALADASGSSLASYYGRHMALVDGVAYGWIGRDEPRALRSGVRQVGVGQDNWYTLLDDGALQRWKAQGAAPVGRGDGCLR